MQLLFSAIAVILCLTVTGISADNSTCLTQCLPENEAVGSYTRERSVYVVLGPNTQEAFYVKTQIYIAYTVKYSLGFAISGKFAMIINIKTGVYILVDHKTRLSVYGKIKVTFLTSSNQVDYQQFITQSNEILGQYTSITTSTKDYFDFELLIIAFYSYKNFDIETIFDNKELVTVLQESFSGWFALIQAQIKIGGILLGHSYWGFISVIYIDKTLPLALLFMDSLKVSITYYQELKTEFIVYAVNELTHSLTSFQTATIKIAAIGLMLGKIDIKLFVEYLQNPQYDATVYEIIVGKIQYEITIYRVKSSFVILFTLVVNNISIPYKVAYVNGVLYIFNLQKNIVLALQASSVLVANITSGSVLVADLSNNLKVKLSAFENATFIQQISETNAVEASLQVAAYVKENKSSGRECNLQAFIEAVIKGNVKHIGHLIGSVKLSAQFITSFKEFLSSIKINPKVSLSAFAIGAFGIEVKSNIIVKSIAQVLTIIISKGNDLSTFLAAFIKVVVAAGSVSSSG